MSRRKGRRAATKAETKKCRECASVMKVRAIKCAKCGAYQRAFRYRYYLIAGILATAVPILTYFTGVIPKVIHMVHDYIHRESETSVRVAQVTDRAIYLFVSNKGRKESILRGYTLDFGDVPIERAVLEPISADVRKIVIAPGSAVTIGLTSRGLSTKQITKGDALSRLKAKTATLSVEVEESNNPHHLLATRLPLDGTMREFVKNRIEDDVHF